MTYDRDDYLIDNEDDEYLTSILVDVNSRYYVLFSSNGDEKKVECDTVEDFMQVLELVRTVCDEEMVFYCEHLVEASKQIRLLVTNKSRKKSGVFFDPFTFF